MTFVQLCRMYCEMDAHVQLRDIARVQDNFPIKLIAMTLSDAYCSSGYRLQSGPASGGASNSEKLLIVNPQSDPL